MEFLSSSSASPYSRPLSFTPLRIRHWDGFFANSVRSGITVKIYSFRLAVALMRRKIVERECDSGKYESEASLESRGDQIKFVAIRGAESLPLQRDFQLLKRELLCESIQTEMEWKTIDNRTPLHCKWSTLRSRAWHRNLTERRSLARRLHCRVAVQRDIAIETKSEESLARPGRWKSSADRAKFR
jgi:hypothetical protein